MIAQIVDEFSLADLEAPETLWALNRVPYLVTKARKYGFKGIDRSALQSHHLEIPQAVALFLYNREDGAGRKKYHGIYYSSRLGARWHCVALFSSRVRLKLLYMQPLSRDMLSFRQALHFMNLSLESRALGQAQGFGR